MSNQQPAPHGAGASFSSLPGDVIAEIACALAANELCRLQSLDRSINNTLQGLVSPAVNAAQQAPTRPRGLHYCSILELRTRAEQHVPLDELPLFSSAFETPPAPAAPAAAAAVDNDGEPADAAAEAVVEDAVDNGAPQQQEQQQQQPALQPANDPVVQQQEQQQQQPALQPANDPVVQQQEQQQQQPVLQPANDPVVQQQVAAEVRPHLKALTAAALLGGWWGDAELGTAARAAGLAAVSDAMGGDVAACVDKVTESDACPAAAKGFWGCITLALLLSTTSAATIRGAATLVQQLLNIGRPDSAIPASLVPALAPDIQADAAADGAPSAGAAAAPARRWLQPAPSRYLYYHIREYLSALLMLLRCKPLLMPGLVEQGALQELRYQVSSVMLHHRSAEDDAATLALQGMPGVAGYQQQDEQLLRKMGLRQGQQLTAEQVRVLHRAFSVVGQGQRISVSNAFAGTAKSTTLLMMMHAFPHLRILYTAFNNTVVNDAKAHAPPNVDCKTTHVLAGAKMHELKARNNWYLGPSWNLYELKGHLNRLPYFAQSLAQRGKGAGWNHAADVRDTLNCFMASGDDRIMQSHLPKMHELLVPSLSGMYVPIVQQFWDAFVQNRLMGKVTFTHNCYLKLFQMELAATGVQLCDAQGRPYDAILVDEAQDMNGVTMALLLAQMCTQLWAGDRHQHIYTFNFCIDALSIVAQRPGSQHLPLSQSFRLGPQVAEVANRILWMLGERSRALVGKGFDHAAVYVFRDDPAQQDDDEGGDDDDGGGANGADAAAAAAAEGPNGAGAAAGAGGAAAAVAAGLAFIAGAVGGAVNAAAAADAPMQQQPMMRPPGAFRQLQLLRDPIIATERTPERLGSITVEVRDNKGRPWPVTLAVPPVDPSTGRRMPLAYISRGNSLWVQVAAALVSLPPRGDEQGAEPGNGGSSNSSSPAEVAAAGGATAGRQAVRLYLTGCNPNTQRIEFLEDRVMDLYRFWAQQVPRYRQYNSWKDLEESRSIDADLSSAIRLVLRYKHATPRIVESILNARVDRKADADYILGTCHKAKGTEEDFVQLADDFHPIADGKIKSLPVDEYNLLYVAATRAKVALVCNKDVQQMLLLAAEMRPVLVQLPPAQAADEDGPQQQCIGCGELRNYAADAAENAGGVRISRGMRHGGAAGAQVLAGYDLCAVCVRRETIWGQLTPQA